MLRWTRGEVGAEAGIKDGLVIVLEVVVVVVAGEDEGGEKTGSVSNDDGDCDGGVKGWFDFAICRVN